MNQLLGTITSRMRSTFILFTVFLCLGAMAYFVTHLYLTTTSYETMLNWYASEAVELQEGNLLGAVTKIQRMKSSTDFIRGVLLLDRSLQKQGELIQFGNKIDPESIPADLQEITVKDAGFFQQYVMMALPKDPSKILVFNIQSVYLRNIFLGLSFALFLLFAIFRFFVLLNRNSEVQRRELMIKEALGGLLSQGDASAILIKEHPELVAWWSDKRSEFDLAQASLAESKTQVLFASMAAQVAHDIRSPLGFLNTAIENMDQDKKIDRVALKFAAVRLNKITEDLIKDRAQALPSKPAQRPVDEVTKPFKPRGNSVQLEESLKNLILEKECLYQHLSGISFKLEIPNLTYEAIYFEPDLLARHLSNLIDNSVDATALSGEIILSFKKVDGKMVFELRDSGSGVPEAILERFGEIGNTSKIHGSGMGVHHAKEFIKRYNGDFQVESTQGAGTTIWLIFPSPPKKTLVLSKNKSLVFLDDDPISHSVWAHFLTEQNLEAVGFYKFEDYQQWAAQNPGHTLFCDHDLKAEKNGLDILEGIPEREYGFLVTNSFDDSAVVARARLLGIPLIPKSHLHEYQVYWI